MIINYSQPFVKNSPDIFSVAEKKETVAGNGVIVVTSGFSKAIPAV